MIENIRSLIKDPNPWSWSYKVSVPAQWKDLMNNPEMYPPEWESRTFTQWPSRQQQGGQYGNFHTYLIPAYRLPGVD